MIACVHPPDHSGHCGAADVYIAIEPLENDKNSIVDRIWFLTIAVAAALHHTVIWDVILKRIINFIIFNDKDWQAWCNIAQNSYLQ